MKLLTENIWESISKAASTDRKNYVAVAYFGTGGAKLLPLKKGDFMVVDASDSSVRSGATNPSELKKLLNRGVEIYSYPKLHSKVFLLGETLFVGSSNVSINSKDNLFEAVLETNQSLVLEQAEKYILTLTHSRITKEEIFRLQEIYKPPKWINAKGKEKKGEFEPRIYLMKIEERRFSPGHELVLDHGRLESKKKGVSEEELEEYEWSGAPRFVVGDIALDYYSDKNYFEPPKRIVHIEYWEGTNKCFVFCKKSVKSKKKFGLKLITILGEKLRQGFLSEKISEKILQHWDLTYNQL